MIRRRFGGDPRRVTKGSGREGKKNNNAFPEKSETKIGARKRKRLWAVCAVNIDYRLKAIRIMEKRGIKKPPVGAKIRLALASASRGKKKKKKDGGKPLRVDRSLRKGQTSCKKFFFFFF